MSKQNFLNYEQFPEKIKWLEFTIKDYCPSEVILKLLFLECSDFKKMLRGRLGYNSQYKWENGDVYILYNEDKFGNYIEDENGVHVIMTRKGYESLSNYFDLRSLFMHTNSNRDYAEKIDKWLDKKIYASLSSIISPYDDITDYFELTISNHKKAFKRHYIDEKNKCIETIDRQH